MKYTFEYSTKTENNLVRTVTADNYKDALTQFYREVGETVYFVELKAKKGVTPAQTRANKKYNAANVVRINLVVNKKTESDLYDFIFSLENKSGFIKNLIREEMKRRSQ